MKKERMHAKTGSWIRLAVLAALIALAAALVWTRMERTEKPPYALPEETPAPTAALRDSRLVREDAYEKDLAEMRELAQSQDEAVSRQAGLQMENMIRAHQSELAIEEALHASGYPDALVVAHGNAVTVLLSADQMTKENSARILALCVSYAEVSAENVRIMAQ